MLVKFYLDGQRPHEFIRSYVFLFRITHAGEETDDSDDDIPLARLVQGQPVLHNTGNANQCETFTCQDEVWAACPSCSCLLCFNHFEESSPCHPHNRFDLPHQAYDAKPTETGIDHATTSKAFDDHLDYVILNLDDIPLNEILITETEQPIDEVPEKSAFEEIHMTNEPVKIPEEQPVPVLESSACGAKEKESHMTGDSEPEFTPEEHPLYMPESSACDVANEQVSPQTATSQPEDFL